jgi:hypothetical protein
MTAEEIVSLGLADAVQAVRDLRDRFDASAAMVEFVTPRGIVSVVHDARGLHVFVAGTQQ